LDKITTWHKINLHPISYFVWWRSWLQHVTTNLNVAGLITDGVVKIFLWHNSSGRRLLQKKVPAIFPEGSRRPVVNADKLTTCMCQRSWNQGAWTSLKTHGLSRPVQGLLYILQ